MHSEVAPDPNRLLAALVAPLRWLWRTLRLIFGASLPVKRWQYVVAGIFFFALRYCFEARIVEEHLGLSLWLNEFLTPYFARGSYLSVNGAGSALLWGSLPFLWIGVTMSVRRAVDARLPFWVGLLFLVPGIHYGVCLALALWPSPAAGAAPLPFGGPYREPRRAPPPAEQERALYPGTLLKSLLLAPFAGVVLGTCFGGGEPLFAIPATTGAVAAFIYAASVSYKRTDAERRASVRRMNGRLLAWCIGGLAAMALGLGLVGPLLGFATLLLYLVLLLPALALAGIAFLCIAVTPWTRWQ